ncbi:MAG: glycerol-3-phosphate acyltransferase [Firmicutes bacterium]|nr:glycerol-3-phosphate acyltransferase [Bacillota bacterium]
MHQLLIIALLAIGSYLFGNLNFALIIARFKGIDLKKKGSGNLGTMNTARNLGIKFGFLVLFLDALKGMIPCIIGWVIVGAIGFGEVSVNGIVLEASQMGAHIAGFFVILGHVYPVLLKFKGGKGIASTIGVALVLQPFVALITFAAAFVFISITRMGSITSFIVITVPLTIDSITLPYFSDSSYSIVSAVFIFLLFVLTIFAHRTNIVKLFLGTESKTGVFKTKKEREEKKLRKLKEI